jgi:tRNA dimethylallyltransferase
MEQKNKIILLAGPTASGKSTLAIKIAQQLNGEIINADSMQIYKEISILTSKPKVEQMGNIKHHLYGFVSVKEKFSTGDWLKLSIKKIEEIWKEGNIPIIVGGTGLYFKALTNGLVKIPNIPNHLKLEVKKMHTQLGQKKFFDLLVKEDPLAKQFVLPTDTQRSMRVFEVKKFMNKSLFELIKETKSNFPNEVFLKLFISTPKELLHTKIEKRVEKMIEDGALKEVENFLNMKVYRELSANKILGVKEIKDHLKGKIKLSETKELIVLKTRQYAKRQFTWSRGHMKSWDMIYSSNINELLKKAINKIA